jgi:hypothetical protein
MRITSRIVLGLFLLLAGIGHLSWSRTEFFAQVPKWLPLNANLVVILSGIVGITLGVALITLPKLKIKLGWIRYRSCPRDSPPVSTGIGHLGIMVHRRMAGVAEKPIEP